MNSLNRFRGHPASRWRPFLSQGRTFIAFGHQMARSTLFGLFEWIRDVDNNACVHLRDVFESYRTKELVSHV